MESKAISAIEHLEAIIKSFESYYYADVERLPECLTERIFKMERLSFELKGYCKRGICADIIREAVNGMDWKIIVDVHGDTDAEEWALYDTIANLNEIAKSNEPQQTHDDPEVKPMGLDEKLAFVPETHREAAKAAFERLLRDGWIKSTPTGFEWIKHKTNALICYFADLANDKWELRNKDGNKSEWKQFANLFAMEAKTFRNWKSDQKNHTGEVPPKNGDKVKAYFQ